MSATTCPKCGYTRRAAEQAPDWQCPSCGIAYRKFRDANASAERPAPQAGAAAPDLRERTLFSAGGGDKVGAAAIFTYVLLCLSVIVLMPLPAARGLLLWLPLAFAACAFYFWLGAYRRLRTVADVPTSSIGTAAQGYVELSGTVAPAAGHALVGHLTRVPCAWYRYTCYHYDNKRHDEGARGVPFVLRDATGECLVDAGNAEVVSDRCQSWSRDGTTFKEWSIRIGDPAYVIGHFTSSGAEVERHLNLQAAYALAGLERKPQEHADRLDTNRDGKVDRQEAAAGREAVRREILEEAVHRGGLHALGPSPDGRPFLVIAADHRKVISRYRGLALLHLAMFLAALGVCGYFWIELRL